MTISGPLTIKDLRNDSDLETKAKNFLKLNLNHEFLHVPELEKEINFLTSNGYILKKENLKYETTEKGREYARERS